MKKELFEILILDDEFPIRKLLRECIPWDRLHVHICGEAASAEEAFRFIGSMIPDIIFVDINLPVENGISFSRKILEKYPDIQIIILTGYEEFDYVQECLRIGVADFLTKPIDIEEVQNTVQKAIKRIEEHLSLAMRYESARRMVEHSAQISRENFLLQLLHGLITPDIFNLQDSNLQNWLLADIFQVAILQSQEKLPNHAVEALRAFASETASLLCTLPDPFHFVLISNHPDLFSSVILPELSEMMAQENIFCNAGIGCARSGIPGIHLSSEEALTALNFGGEATSGNITHYISIADETTTDHHKEHLLLRRICQFIRAGKEQEAVKIVSEGLMRHSSALSLNLCRESAIEIAYAIMEMLEELHIHTAGAFPDGDMPLKKIFQLTSPKEIISYLESMITTASMLLNGKSNRNLIDDILSYLAENYHNESLSLQKTAKEFHVNYSYLSRLFKEKTGINFSEYMTLIRVKEATLLLTDSDLKIYEIAANVGFSDPHYLEICFKKINHISMSKYRELNQTPH